MHRDRIRRATALTTALVTSGAAVLAARAAGTAAPAAPGTATHRSTAHRPAPPCRPHYRPADPHRPRMTLAVKIGPSHRVVDGRERLAFTPDLPVRQLVFRLTANSPGSVAAGTRVTVLAARADHGGLAARYSRAGAPACTQGGLLRIPLRHRVLPETTVHTVVHFRLRLGHNDFDRFGRNGGFAWFGSGEPLLAWQDGVGWHTEPLSALDAETTTSEAMDVHLDVRAPRRDVVVASGDPRTAPAGHGATRLWRAHIARARDVSVAVGPFHVADGHADGVPVRVGARTTSAAQSVLRTYSLALRRLAARFGPYPYASLSVARLPGAGGGIEYPADVLAFNSAYSLAVHETAHQWFYGMLGDSQASHPWLDEAFAVYAQTVVGNDPPPGREMLDPYYGTVDRPVSAFSSDGPYLLAVYLKGGEALIYARQRAGAHRWDAAMRCYVADNAWRIVVPRDVARAFADLPKGEAVLRHAGAIR